MTKPIVATALALAAVLGVLPAAPTAHAQSPGLSCEAARHRPDLFKVAIDRDSGIAFVRSPCGYTYMGVVARETIDEDIRMSDAEPVPADVLRAEVMRQPELARFLPVRESELVSGGSAR